MYVKIDNTAYTVISNLQFEPETDVTGSKVPVNELWVSVKTDDEIALGSRVSLYDDADTLWAKYWVTYAEREDKYNIRVHGESALIRIDSVTLDPVMYESDSVGTVLSEVLSPLNGEYVLDSELASKTLSGYAPKQTARVRLQWICLVIGAYLKNSFNDRLEILPIDDESQLIIPLADTYWKPKVTYNDHVTAIKATYYEYVQGVPSRTDDYVTIGDRSKGETEVYYIQTKTEVTLTNNQVPSGARENVITLDNITLLNEDNVSEVMSFMAKYRFMRTELQLDAIDNGTYMPGQRVYAFMDEDTMVEGYIESCSFSFGLQAKASMHFTAVEVRESAALSIAFTWEGRQVGYRVFRFPVGYDFEVENPYIDVCSNGHRYVFRPLDKTVSGTMPAEGIIVTQPVEIALDMFEGKLHVVSVDKYGMVDKTIAIS
jgi:hypothetical protein